MQVGGCVDGALLGVSALYQTEIDMAEGGECERQHLRARAAAPAQGCQQPHFEILAFVALHAAPADIGTGYHTSKVPLYRSHIHSVYLYALTYVHTHTWRMSHMYNLPFNLCRGMYL